MLTRLCSGLELSPILGWNEDPASHSAPPLHTEQLSLPPAVISFAYPLQGLSVSYRAPAVPHQDVVGQEPWRCSQPGHLRRECGSPRGVLEERPSHGKNKI
ncbi:uncharacterized protein AB9W97_016138 isoform 4-T4 [Spinachia spinachia]